MLKELRARSGVSSLLSKHNSNPKTAKAEEKLGIRTAVLHLAPANVSGYEVCPARSPGCTAACLHYAGNPVFFTRKHRARTARTRFFFEDRPAFLALLHREIAAHKRAADRAGQQLAVRLNATSDIPWERIDSSIFTDNPDVIFYDYTAVISRLRRGLPENLHLTFSMKEGNYGQCLEALALGFNLAVVFEENSIPDRFMGLPVVDGDDHDFRPADPRPCVVGLKAKGRAKHDVTGFVGRAQVLPLAA